MGDYNFNTFNSLNNLVAHLTTPPDDMNDPTFAKRVRFQTIVDKVYEPSRAFNGQFCSMNIQFHSRGDDHTTDPTNMQDESLYLNFVDYAADAFEFVSYLTVYQVDDLSPFR